MTQNLGNFVHGGAAMEHPDGEGVAQQMSALSWRVESGTRQRAPNGVAYSRGTCKSLARSFRADEYPACCTMWTSVEQVIGEGFAYIMWNGQPVVYASFSPHGQLPKFPMDIVQLHVFDFAGTQPQASQQQQYRVVTFPDFSAETTSRHNGFNLNWLEKFGQCGKFPFSHGWHTQR
jgi:hypothetical protein